MREPKILQNYKKNFYLKTNTIPRNEFNCIEDFRVTAIDTFTVFKDNNYTCKFVNDVNTNNVIISNYRDAAVSKTIFEYHKSIKLH